MSAQYSSLTQLGTVEFESLFAQYDGNGDGVLTHDEYVRLISDVKMHVIKDIPNIVNKYAKKTGTHGDMLHCMRSQRVRKPLSAYVCV